jgi:hypothetical protein
MRRVPHDYGADSDGRDVFPLEKLWRPVHESQRMSMLQGDRLLMRSEYCGVLFGR